MSKRTSRLARLGAALISLGMVATGATILAAPTQAAAPKLTATDFAFTAQGWGSRITNDIAEFNPARIGYSNVACTRMAGRRSLSEGLLDALPEEVRKLIRLELLSSSSETYQAAGGVFGSRGITTIGDIQLGPSSGPFVRIEGLQSVADSFFTPGKGFGTKTGFTFNGIKIDVGDALPEEISAPLQNLLDTIQDNVNGPVNTLVKAVTDVLAIAGPNGIEIPGLGKIALGHERSNVRAGKSAEASTYALQLHLDAIKTNVDLGRAWSRISRNVPDQVFHGSAMVGRVNLADVGAGPVVLLGRILMNGAPCEGTGGKFRTSSIGESNILGGLVKVAAAKSQALGHQRANGSAVSVIRSTIGRVELLGPVPIVVEGLVSQSRVVQNKKGRIITRSAGGTRIGRVLVGGKEVKLDASGVTRFDGGYLQSLLSGKNTQRLDRGLAVTGLRIGLDDAGPIGRIVELGVATARIRRN